MATIGTGTEYQMYIRIGGIVDASLTSATTTATAQLTTFQSTIKAMNSDFTTLDKYYNKIISAGKTVVKTAATVAVAAAAAVGAAVYEAVQIGSEFESAFADVKKTVDATEEEFDELREDIIQMSTEIPASLEDISEVMATAGQLGIATDSLTEFTETMINLGVAAEDLTADEAATYLAKFANIVQMDDYDENGVSNWNRLGSAVTALGNNFATTEADIISMATNLASTGDLVGMSESDILAYATAMSSVGIKAEKGASAMAKLLKKIQLAVETSSDSLYDYANVADMTEEEFSELWNEDAAAATAAFIDGLNDTDRLGQSAVVTLNEMGLTEVRLSQVITSLAGAEGILTEAVETASEAWDENTALTEEATEKYKTLENQWELLKNIASALALNFYDEIRDSLGTVVSTLNEWLTKLNNWVAQDMASWLNGVSSGIATLKRYVSKYSGVISGFFGTLYNIFQWCVKNKSALIGMLEGLGTALATYKVASTTVHFINALTDLAGMKPAVQGILAIIAAIGAVVSAIQVYNGYLDQLADNSLAEHFGNIVLSMEDIAEAVDHIIGSASLTNAAEAMEAFDALDEYADAMDSAISELNKMNWKVSIGMELTEDEAESYQEAIDEYVEAAQDYALQSEYAVTISLSSGLGDSDEAGDITSKVQALYEGYYDEMTTLGEELSDAVNEAFEDGLLDDIELTQIADIQSQMADLQAELAASEYEATLSLISTEYANGAALDSESYINLQSEIQDAIDEAKATYDEQYTTNYAALTYSYGEGGLTDEEYAAALDLLESEYLQNLLDLETTAASFETDTITTAYSDEIASVSAAVAEAVEGLSVLENAGELDDDTINTIFEESLAAVKDASGLNKDDRLAFADLYDTLQDELDDLQELADRYTASGESIPAEITEALNNIYAIGAASGDEDAILSLMADQITDDEELATLIELAETTGALVPDTIAEAIESDESYAEIQESVAFILDSIEAGLEEGIDSVSIPVSYTVVTNALNALDAGMSANDVDVSDYNAADTISNYIDSNATGGLVTSPELTWFAENGPEMAIPIDGSENAKTLWAQTGELLGMTSVLDGADSIEDYSSTVEYAPTINFYGDSPSKDDITSALSISEDEFEQLMDKYLKNKRRYSYG